MYQDAEESLARIRGDVERAEARAAALPKLQESMSTARGDAVSVQHDISVSVDSTGALVSLVIKDAALNRGGQRLSYEVMKLVAGATLSVRREMASIARDLLGESDPIVDVLRHEIDAARAPHVKPTSEVTW